MSKASRCYTGSKQSVGTPTLNKTDYYQLIRKVRMEKQAKAKNKESDGRTNGEHG